jgi:hypothetical protein
MLSHAGLRHQLKCRIDVTMIVRDGLTATWVRVAA